MIAEEARWEADADLLSAVSVNGLTAISADEFAAVEYGDFVTNSDDGVYRVTISTGAQTQLGTTTGQYMLGTLAYDTNSGLLLVPDADAGLRRFTLSAESVTEGALVPLTMTRGIPPRHAYLLTR